MYGWSCARPEALGTAPAIGQANQKIKKELWVEEGEARVREVEGTGTTERRSMSPTGRDGAGGASCLMELSTSI